MADDKRNRGDQQQGGNQGSPDRPRGKDRKPGSGTMESPEDRARREEEEEQQE
jgi:hypothetical protein